MPQKPEDDRDPIDDLSGDFDSCPPTADTSEPTAKVLCFSTFTFFECVFMWVYIYMRIVLLPYKHQLVRFLSFSICMYFT